ncbi:MAG: aldo/keto reductase [Pseudomonadota bacterium]|jgi:D-threo-aldose 1-dehydrogenase
MRFDPSKIILGTANLGGLFLDGKVPDVSRAEAIVGRALSMGITRFDTAPLYGWGASEFFLGRALEKLGASRDGLYISTKALRALYPCVDQRDTTQPDFWTLGEPNRRFTHKWRVDYDSVMQTTLRSLEALRISYIDGLSLHDPWDALNEDRSITWEGIADGLRAISELKRAGFVRQIGYGGKETTALRTIIERHPQLLTYVSTTTYTLVDQSFASEGMFELCAQSGLEFRAAGPFCSRLLAQDPRKAVRCCGKDGVDRWYYNGDLDMPVTFNYGYISDDSYSKACTLWSIVERFGESSPRAAALQFVLSHPGVSGVIVGASTPAHLDELKAAIERPLKAEIFKDLCSAGIIDAALPTP